MCTGRSRRFNIVTVGKESEYAPVLVRSNRTGVAHREVGERDEDAHDAQGEQGDLGAAPAREGGELGPEPHRSHRRQQQSRPREERAWR
jgi:hypothetical protein